MIHNLTWNGKDECGNMSDNGEEEDGNDDDDDDPRMQVEDKMRIEGTRRKIETQER